VESVYSAVRTDSFYKADYVSSVKVKTVTLLTPYSRVLLEKLTSFQPVKKLPSFYGARKFITAFTNAHLLTKVIFLFWRRLDGEVICVVMRLRVQISWEDKDFSFLQIIRTASYVHHPLVQWVQWFFFDYCSSSSAKVTNEYNYTLTSCINLYGVDRKSFNFYSWRWR
jgi:hypothetical protein